MSTSNAIVSSWPRKMVIISLSIGRSEQMYKNATESTIQKRPAMRRTYQNTTGEQFGDLNASFPQAHDLTVKTRSFGRCKNENA